jgi:hypothetical protein
MVRRVAKVNRSVSSVSSVVNVFCQNLSLMLVCNRRIVLA